MADPRRAHLRLDEFSDRELLHALEDVCQQTQGWASAHDVADHIGLGGVEPHRPVGQRLAWQTRFGAVEREHARDEAGNIRYHRDGRPMFTQNWRLSEPGRALLFGTLRKGDQTVLDRLDDGQMLEVTHWLTRRTMRDDGSPVTSKLVAREWQYAMAQRRR